jgi:hypothetical protein
MFKPVITNSLFGKIKLSLSPRLISTKSVELAAIQRWLATASRAKLDALSTPWDKDRP